VLDFNPFIDTLLPGTVPRYHRREFNRSNWALAFTRSSVDWTDARGVWHRARYDIPGEGNVEIQSPAPVERQVETAEVEIEKSGGDEKAVVDASSLPKRKRAPSRFIWTWK
jgi:hypothetical protein